MEEYFRLKDIESSAYYLKSVIADLACLNESSFPNKNPRSKLKILADTPVHEGLFIAAYNELNRKLRVKSKLLEEDGLSWLV